MTTKEIYGKFLSTNCYDVDLCVEIGKELYNSTGGENYEDVIFIEFGGYVFITYIAGFPKRLGKKEELTKDKQFTADETAESVKILHVKLKEDDMKKVNILLDLDALGELKERDD